MDYSIYDTGGSAWDNHKRARLMYILALCAAVLAFLSFAMPVFTADGFWESYSLSGFEYISEIFEDDVSFAGSSFVSALSSTTGCLVLIILGLVMKKKDIHVWMIVIANAVATTALLEMIFAVSFEDYYTDSDFFQLGAGFYVFLIAIIAIIVCGLLGAAYEGGRLGTKDPVIHGTTRCPHCGKAVPGESKFCPYCGAISILEEPETTDCPGCGKKLSPGTKFCPYCGNSTTPVVVPEAPQVVYCEECGKKIDPAAKFCPHCGSSTMPATPPVVPPVAPPKTPFVPPVTPPKDPFVPLVVSPENSVTVPAKKPPVSGEKVICPHCGARQPATAEKCKYCGTALH